MRKEKIRMRRSIVRFKGIRRRRKEWEEKKDTNAKKNWIGAERLVIFFLFKPVNL